FWFSVVVRSLISPWFGFDRDGRTSSTSLSTRNSSPGRTGFGQRNSSNPAPMTPPAGLSSPSTRRLERLRQQGKSDEDLTRIRAPAGLSIGAKGPAEIAVSTCRNHHNLARRALSSSAAPARLHSAGGPKANS